METSLPSLPTMMATELAAAVATASATPTPELPLIGPNKLYVRAVLFWIAGAFAMAAVCVSTYHIVKHLTNYRRPDMQRRIVRILLMVPIYAIDSWFSLRFVQASLYLNTVRNVYEAYVLYQFFALLVCALDGEQELQRTLARKTPLPHSWPLDKCIRPISVAHPNFLLRVKQSLMQFVVLKPVVALLTIIFQATHTYGRGEWRLDRAFTYLVIVDNVSITIAFYGLLVFYRATHTDLAPFRPVWKFLCVKVVIFFSFWQSMVIAGLSALNVVHDVGTYTADDVSSGLQDFLICIEMFFAALLHAYAFPSREYEDMPNCSKLPIGHTLRDVFQLKDVVDDTTHTFRLRPGSNNYNRLSNQNTLEDLEFDDDDDDVQADYARVRENMERTV